MERVFRVAHFYGWTLSEVKSMRAREFESAFSLINRLTAERALLDMSIAQYPHSKDKYRQSLHRELYSAAHPADPDAPAVGIESLAQMLAGGGI